MYIIKNLSLTNIWIYPAYCKWQYQIHSTLCYVAILVAIVYNAARFLLFTSAEINHSTRQAVCSWYLIKLHPAQDTAWQQLRWRIFHENIDGSIESDNRSSNMSNDMSKVPDRSHWRQSPASLQYTWAHQNSMFSAVLCVSSNKSCVSPKGIRTAACKQLH